MISATREERMIIVTGLVAAFVGTALGFAHGGFWSLPAPASGGPAWPAPALRSGAWSASVPTTAKVIR